ncbi:transcriptional regulator [Archaeoglobales archaeon]|mgnify:CR=1 FL=1|nr:MAG: transcriptional regulator [Archaeoglobales archaeon]
MQSKEELDYIDRKIIGYILKGKIQSEIADMLNITLRTVQNRTKALERKGYLKKLKEGLWVADYQKLGLEMLTVGFIDLDISSKNKLDELIEHLKKLDFVENVFETVGSYDLCFIVRYRDIREYHQERRKFMEWLRKKGFKVNHYHAIIASKTHKNHRRTIV